MCLGLLARLPLNLTTCMPTWLPAGVPACLSVNLPARLPTSWSLLLAPPTGELFNVTACLPTLLPANLPDCLSAHLNPCLPGDKVMVKIQHNLTLRPLNILRHLLPAVAQKLLNVPLIITATLDTEQVCSWPAC